jgi:carboxyl-terminal processing protease
MIKSTFWQKLLTVIVVISVAWLSWTTNATAYYNEEEKIFLQAWRIVNQAYLDETFNEQNWWFVRERFLEKDFSDRSATYEAIEEMLATLDDPFTRLLRPEQYRSLQVNTSGELSGVGLQIDINPKTKQLEVVTPIDGSPAEKAGIKPRDRVLAIDGVKTKNLTLDEAASRMRGKVGTPVTLTVQSGEGEEASTREVEIVRDRISLNPVYARLDDSSSEFPIGYIRLAQFSANATREIAHSVADLEEQGAEGFILDLRNNPGGLLQAGIEVARLWLNSGTVVYTVNRQGMIGSYGANESAVTDAPLIVLVNQGSASASEILAGALQDNDRAQIVGETTFGKGLIQSLFELPDDSGVAVTVAKYETPSHRDINEAGIEPDYKVSQSLIPFSQMGTEKDEQYQQAVKLLTQKKLVAQH